MNHCARVGTLDRLYPLQSAVSQPNQFLKNLVGANIVKPVDSYKGKFQEGLERLRARKDIREGSGCHVAGVHAGAGLRLDIQVLAYRCTYRRLGRRSNMCTLRSCRLEERDLQMDNGIEQLLGR